MLNTVDNRELEPSICIHCGNSCETELTYEQESFCCSGCLAAYRSIKQNGLDYFYDLRDSLLETKTSQILEQNSLNYLDDIETSRHFMNEDGYYRFYVSGIQCAACIWLLESLPKVNGSILEVRIHFLDHTLEVLLANDAKPSEAFHFIQSFGYTLNPIKSDESGSHFQNEETKKKLNHIAIAAVCAGNIMLLSFADYFGADPGFQKSFRWLSFVLFLPILFYSAKGMLLNALRSTLRLRPSLDLPISIAVLAGFTLSFVSLLMGYSHVYFDSLSVTIFLILSSRYLIATYKEKIMKDFQDCSSLIPEVSRLSNGKFILSENIKIGDLVQIQAGESIACDAIVHEGQAWVNESILSGEANLKAVSKSTLVYAGTHVEKGDISIRCLKTVDDSRFSHLLLDSQHQAMYKVQSTRFEEKFAYYFTIMCILLSGFSLVYFSNQMAEAISRSLALLIVACPCAIAFGSPLIYTRSLKYLSKFKIFLKNIDTLNKIANIKNIIFDKTGTLTKSTFRIQKVDFANEEIKSIILSIQSKSDHPIAKAMCNYYPFYNYSYQVQDMKTLVGRGIEATVKGKKYRILHSNKTSNSIHLEFYEEKIKLGSAVLSEDIKPEAQFLKNEYPGKSLHILSGDNQYLVNRVADFCGIQNMKAQQSPEQKLQYIESLESTMMIGDGINDSAAIAGADIGVSVTGSITKAFQHADVLLLNENILALKKIEIASKMNRRAHLALFSFSVAYNCVTAALAFLGYIQPVVAAILMPLSSALVLLLVHIFTREAVWE